MSVNTKLESKNGLFFITFTCNGWLALFEATKGYDLVYIWFEILRSHQNEIVSYVIMPNHLHVIIHFKNNSKGIDKWISNGKRFMAYELVKRLQDSNRHLILQQLQDDVTPSDKKRGKLHQVFKESFDVKPIYTVDFLLEKLHYIHRNPVSKKWQLVKDFAEYPHSSACFYESQDFKQSGVTPYWEIEWLSLISTKRI